MCLFWATMIWFSAPILILTCVFHSCSWTFRLTRVGRLHAVHGQHPQGIQGSVGFCVKGEIFPEITDCHCYFGLNIYGFCLGLDLGCLPVAFAFCTILVWSRAVLPLTTLRCVQHAPDRSPGVSKSDSSVLVHLGASDFHAPNALTTVSFSEALSDQSRFFSCSAASILASIFCSACRMSSSPSPSSNVPWWGGGGGRSDPSIIGFSVTARLQLWLLFSMLQSYLPSFSTIAVLTLPSSLWLFFNE